MLDEVRKRSGQAGIVYCLRRADVEAVTDQLLVEGIKAAGYHAGMDDAQRTTTQDAFASGETDVVVATVAFGMGIDRSDIRFVIHAAMPKSIEHYQQETGRAGRDGKPADCILLYSGADFLLAKNFIDKDATANKDDQLALLSEMYNFCTGIRCRHEKLVTYFGQSWTAETCESCDVCDGTLALVDDATEIAQKIMSCVVRTNQRFGAGHVADVLRGEPTDRVMQFAHTELSTFGLMPDHTKSTLMAYIGQLVDQGMLQREGEYRILKVTQQGRAVLKGQVDAQLVAVGPKQSQRSKTKSRGRTKRQASTVSDKPAVRSKPAAELLDADARQLFEQLRAIRRNIAGENNVPAFMICSDRTLRDMARKRPTDEEQMLEVVGIGRAKYGSFGQQFIDAIRSATH